MAAIGRLLSHLSLIRSHYCPSPTYWSGTSLTRFIGFKKVFSVASLTRIGPGLDLTRSIRNGSSGLWVRSGMRL
jgi:hypothetical protein